MSHANAHNGHNAHARAVAFRFILLKIKSHFPPMIVLLSYFG